MIEREATRHPRSPWIALLRQRCPRCRDGRLFARGFTMPERCRVCGLRLEREPGYFTGAMYVSYALSVPLVAALALGVHLVFTGLAGWAAILAGWILMLPFVPLLFRYSRTIWLHVGYRISPYD